MSTTPKDIWIHPTQLHKDNTTVIIDLARFSRILKKACVLLIRRVDALMEIVKTKHISVVVLFDTHRSPLKIASFYTWKKFVLYLLERYPCFLHRCYLIDAPISYVAFYQILKPFIDKETQKKIVFT